MIVLGVDPGTAVTGYGVVDLRAGGAVALIECGVVRTESAWELPRRLREIHDGLVDVITRHDVQAVAVEGVFFGKNVRTAIILGHARAAALLAASLRDLPVAEYSPSAVKSAVVGNGKATKEQVQFMVQRLLRLKEPPRPADAADAVAVALCHCASAALPTVSAPRVRVLP